MEEASFNFMAAVTIDNDFGAQENKICHCFHIFPFYLLSPLFMLILHWALDGVQEAGEHSTVVAGMIGVSDPLTQAHPLNPGSPGLHGDVLCCPVSRHPAWQWTTWKLMTGKFKICALPTQLGPLMGPSLLPHTPRRLTTPSEPPG